MSIREFVACNHVPNCCWALSVSTIRHYKSFFAAASWARDCLCISLQLGDIKGVGGVYERLCLEGCSWLQQLAGTFLCYAAACKV